MKQIFLLFALLLSSFTLFSQVIAIDESFQSSQAELVEEGWEFVAATIGINSMELAKKSSGGQAITPQVLKPSQISISTKNSGNTNRSIEISYFNAEGQWTVLGAYTIQTKNEEFFSFEISEALELTRFKIASGGSNPVVITHVTVYGEIPISNETEIMGFNLPEQIGEEEIDSSNATIKLKVPLSANLNVAPSFFIISRGASVSPEKEAMLDFTTPQQYVITAEDGTTTRTWTVNVERAASSGKEITAFKLSNNQLGASFINSVAGTIHVKVPNTVNVATIVPALFTISAGATIDPSLTMALDFTSAVQYTVTAEDKTTKQWTIFTELIDLDNYVEMDFNTIVGWASAPGGPAISTNKPASNVEIPTTTGGTGGETLYFTPDKFGDLCQLLYNRINYKSVENKPVIIVLEPGVWDGSGVTGDGTKVYANNMLTIQEQGDITLLGKGQVQCKFGINIKRSYNIIIRNIYFWGYKDDAINVGERETHHIWIDHCTAGASTQSQIPTNKDAVDGTFEVKNGASYVTVSWCVIQNHWKSCLIGHSDGNGSTDEGRLKVTHYANYYNNTYSRHPRVRFGQVHVLNCLYENCGWGRINSYKPSSSIGLGYGCAASNNSEVFIENNFFLDTQFPFYADRGVADFKNVFGLNDSSTGNKPSKGLKQIGNDYDDNGLSSDLSNKINAAMLNPSEKSIKFDELNPETVFNPADYYHYTAFPVNQVREIVSTYAGAGILSWEELSGDITSPTPIIPAKTEQSNFNVYADDAYIYIQGVHKNTDISIYNGNGSIVYRGKAKSSLEMIPNTFNNGLYIVKSGIENKKIILK
jgi:pectate lyase